MNKRFTAKTPQLFLKVRFPKGRPFLMAGNDHCLAWLSSSSWFSSSVSLIPLCRDVTPWWSLPILGPLKRVGLSYLQPGLMPPLTSAVTKVTEKCQDMTPRCHKSVNLFSEIEHKLRHNIPAYLSLLRAQGTGLETTTSTHPPDDYAVMCVKHLLLCYYSFSSALINCIIASRIIQVAYMTQ